MEATPHKTIYELKHPFVHHSQEVKQLEFVRPKGKHLKGLNLNELKVGDLMRLSAKISGQTDSFFDEMDAEDIMGVNEIVSGFLAPGQ